VGIARSESTFLCLIGGNTLECTVYYGIRMETNVFRSI
jgi:hypothetical protein